MKARLALAAAAGLLLAAPPAGASGAHPLFRFADARITEASGIARGLVSPGVFYVQNDSGNPNKFFAVDRRTGSTAATITVAGARNVDWEDIAVARDRSRAASVWLADIGDNDAVRSSVAVYRVAEPRIGPAQRDRSVRVRVAQRWRLRYPGGPVDAESLAVTPDGTAYIVTKSLAGATVYRVPDSPAGGRVQTLRRVASLGLHPTGTDNPFGLAGQLAVTGAAISPDGALFVVRTYSDAWVWRLVGLPIDRALRREPQVVPLPSQPQGEGVAIVGRSLVVDSEGTHSAVYAVPLPDSVVPTPTPVDPTGTPVEQPSASAPPAADEDTGSVSVGVAVLGAVAVVGAAYAIFRRVRRRR